MRRFKKLIIFLSLWVCANTSAQTIKPLYIKLEIREWGMFFDNSFTITNDSVKINLYSTAGHIENTYSKSFSLPEQETIIEAFSKIELKNIQKNYVDDASPDDMAEYDFKLIINEETKRFHIYQTKVEAIFNLVKQINKLLPSEYQIGYNEKYFNLK